MSEYLQPICKFCKERSLYTCPRCSARYCSSKCYQAPEHTSCSETFYEAQVKQTMQHLRPSPESRQQVQAMLHRLEDRDDLSPQKFCQQWDEGGGIEQEEEELDSDDEEDLATRMKGIDLDDSDAVWSRLTDSERQSFQQMVQNGDVTQILPDYSPWWEIISNKKAPGIVELTQEEAIRLKNDAGSVHSELHQIDGDMRITPSEVEHLPEDDVSGELSQAGDGVKNVANAEQVLHCGGGKDDSIKNKADSSHVEVSYHKKRFPVNCSENVRERKLRKGSSNLPNNVPSQEQRPLLTFFENIPAALREKYTRCPAPISIQPLESLISRPPSPLVRYSLLNTAACYAWLLRLFHGDHQASHGEATEAVLSLCAALASRACFDSVDQALSSIRMRAIQHEWLCPSDTLVETVSGDVATLLTGPSDLPGYYLHCALADLQTVLRGALGDPGTDSNRGGGCDSFLSSLQGAQQTIPRNLATPKIIRLAIKKLDFLISYSFSYRLQIREEFLSIL